MLRSLLATMILSGSILDKALKSEIGPPGLVMGAKTSKRSLERTKVNRKEQGGIQSPILPASVPKICSYPPLLNNDCMSELRWYFDSDVRACLPFQSGSECDANGNNFPSKKVCRHICKTDIFSELDMRSTTEWRCGSPRLDLARCQPQRWPLTRFYYDAALNRCAPLKASGCAAAHTFASLADCTFFCRQADAVAEQVPRVGCRLPAVRGFEICYNGQPRWRFNRAARRCQWFMYSGCFGNWNNFLSHADCQRVCGGRGGPPDVCGLPADVGTSFQYRTRYFFDPTSRSCRPMSYSGFGGNANNFFLPEECEAACMSRQ